MSALDSALTGAEAIRLGYERYRDRFRAITRRARRRFEQRDWRGGQSDASGRLALYKETVESVEGFLHLVLADRLQDAELWKAMKPEYARSLPAMPDAEIAETFFNSLTRRVFTTVGVDPEIEFVHPAEHERAPRGPEMHRTYPVRGALSEAVRAVLRDHGFAVPFQDVVRDSELVADAIDEEWSRSGDGGPVRELRVIAATFFRGSGAYVVGRVRGETGALPMVLVLLNEDGEVAVDAALLTVDEVSIVFSYTRSYFHVDLECPGRVVELLRALMPRKPLAELYISLGYDKHGKTELYRALLRHLGDSTARFEPAPGARGMVMAVFAMPGHDYVFKVIRDRFDPPKTGTPATVKERYSLVFRHDRAGRLIDAQEFEHVRFARARFAPEVLEELASEAASTVELSGDEVVVHHLYMERRMRPLDVYVRAEDPEEARRAILDYGAAIRDLARTNIFPGDFLLKNFGVTRNGRVVFYDYDELCLVTDCRFRELPDDDGLSGEPTFYVAPNDVFPEEFERFLGLRGELRDAFLEAHGELLTPDFWREVKARHERGEVLDVFPYPAGKRLRG